LALYLKDLSFIDEGNPTFVKEKVNIEKYSYMDYFCHKVVAFQRVPFTMEKNEIVSEYILDHLTTVIDDNALLSFSQHNI